MCFQGFESIDHVTGVLKTENKLNIWILSRLCNAVSECIKGFESYDLAIVTNACYNFWLYELCDIYLEGVKPIFNSGSSEDKYVTRKTLYTCLDYGLKLISPIMPFISEELYQRLPHSYLYSSICIAEYPSHCNYWCNELIEKEFEFIQRVAKAIRSARSDYNISNKVKTEAYIITNNDEYKKTLLSNNQILCVMSFCSNIFIDNASPDGCAIITVSGSCEVHLLLKGLIESSKEIEKLQKKINVLQQSLLKLNQTMEDKNYHDKVPENIRVINKDKQKELEAEIDRLTMALSTLKTI